MVTDSIPLNHVDLDQECGQLPLPGFRARKSLLQQRHQLLNVLDGGLADIQENLSKSELTL